MTDKPDTPSATVAVAQWERQRRASEPRETQPPQLLPCPLCRSTNVRPFKNEGELNEIECLDCGCEAPQDSWLRRAAAPVDVQAIVSLLQEAADEESRQETYAGGMDCRDSAEWHKGRRELLEGILAAIAVSAPALVEGERCGCEGSCPVCRIGEVANHVCGKCGAQFCPKCHGLLFTESDKVEQCSCNPPPSFSPADDVSAAARITEVVFEYVRAHPDAYRSRIIWTARVAEIVQAELQKEQEGEQRSPPQ